MTAGVYYILNARNNRIYVGCSHNVEERIKFHLSRLRNDKHDIKTFQNDWNIYGADVFETGLLVEVKPHGKSNHIFHANLVKHERIFFRVYQSENPKFGYNRANRTYYRNRTRNPHTSAANEAARKYRPR